jgi:hypothetical protein
MTDDLKTERVTLMMTTSDLKRLDDWSFEMRIRSRGEAIRRLIDLGLNVSKRQRIEDITPHKTENSLTKLLPD